MEPGYDNSCLDRGHGNFLLSSYGREQYGSSLQPCSHEEFLQCGILHVVARQCAENSLRRYIGQRSRRGQRPSSSPRRHHELHHKCCSILASLRWRVQERRNSLHSSLGRGVRESPLSYVYIEYRLAVVYGIEQRFIKSEFE